MNALTLAAALLAGAAAWLAATGRQQRHRRLLAVTGRPGGPTAGGSITGGPASGGRSRGGTGASGGDPRDALAARATAAAAVAGVAATLVVGGVAGIAAGVAVAVAVRVVLGRLEPRSVRERRTALARQAPDVADLLAACLASGAPIGSAVASVARAVGEPVATPLRSVVGTLDLGGDLVDAWSALTVEPGLTPLGRAVARSLDSGAPLGDVLPGIADDLRRASRVEAETAARAAGVRAVAPLAACFLPAFLLLGVVPVVASLADALITGS